MPEIRTSKQSKRPLLLLGGVIVLVVLSIFTWGWLTKEREESLIIPGGPFDTYFAKGLYPDKKLEIENWFQKTLPSGTSRSDAKRILAASFSSEITGGNEVLIDGRWRLGGSSETKVTLIFGEDDSFKEAKVSQHWAYL